MSYKQEVTLRCERTNEELYFKSYRECDVFLGRSHNYTGRMIKEGLKTLRMNGTNFQYRIINIQKGEPTIRTGTKRQPPKLYSPPEVTLCWGCQKAVCGCSWSRGFKPVDGWDAIPTLILNGMKVNENGMQEPNFDTSFIVKSCPEYQPDIRRKII